MPTYMFCSPVKPDPEPMELADDDTAWSEAIRMCGEMLRDTQGQIADGTIWEMIVLDGGSMVEVARIEIRCMRRSLQA